MNVGIHIEADILSCLFCILLFYQQKRHKVFDFLGSTAFNSLLWASVGIMVVDIVSWFFMGNLVPHTDHHLMLIQTLYYLLQALLPLYFMVYCLNTTGNTLSRSTGMLMYIPVLFTLLVLAINVNTGFAFYVLDNSVVRGPGFLLAIISPMIYLTNSLILCLIFYFRSRNDTVERRKIAFHMLICILISFIGALACSVINYISPWHVFVASLVYLYIQLHSHREHHLDVLAFTDSLTGLKNHAAYSLLKEKMEQKLSNDPHTHFALAMMDINDLKKVNDVHGHKAGNALIICAAQLLCHVFAHSPVCRIGGDEFIAILEHSDYENRAELSQKFADQMRNTTFWADDQQLPLTVALGICVYDPVRHSSFDDVFQEADSTMYENKSLAKKKQK